MLDPFESKFPRHRRLASVSAAVEAGTAESEAKGGRKSEGWKKKKTYFSSRKKLHTNGIFVTSSVALETKPVLFLRRFRGKEGGARRLGTCLVALGENTQNLKRLASSTPALYSALLSGWLPGRQECVRGGNEDGMEKNKRNIHRFLPSFSESLVAVSKSGGGGVGGGAGG